VAGNSGKKVMGEYVLEEAHDLERLAMAASCLDDISEAEKQVKLDGVFVRDRYGQVKENPASKVIRENRVIFCRIIRELGLDIETSPESRLPRKY
jgi:phage terminase small subunit